MDWFDVTVFWRPSYFSPCSHCGYLYHTVKVYACDKEDARAKGIDYISLHFNAENIFRSRVYKSRR